MKNGGPAAFKGLKTTDVCEKFLKPTTASAQESYCVAFKKDPGQERNIGKATAFVSHAWGQQFMDVVAALQTYEMSDPHRRVSTFFWFDIFSNNQHKTAVRDFTWWQTVFRDNIGKIKKTLMVLEWEDPKPLSRAWCLWEIVSTVNTKSDFQVIMSLPSGSGFFMALEKNFAAVVSKLLSVDVSKAQAFNPSDEANIKKAVEATAGFDKVNQQVIKVLREWMFQVSLNVFAGTLPDIRALQKFGTNVARLLHELGMLQEAKVVYENVVKDKRRVMGDEDLFALLAMSNLGLVRSEIGEQQEGEAQTREALSLYERKHQADDSQTCVPYINLAKVLFDQGKYAESQGIYVKTLDVMTKMRLRKDPIALVVLNGLGDTLRAQGKISEAEPLLAESLQQRQEDFGPKHPYTLESLHAMAQLLVAKGKSDEAESRLTEALRLARLVLGNTHPSTLAVTHTLASLNRDQKKFSEAETLAQRALSGRRRVLGRRHPDSLKSEEHLVTVLKALGKGKEADAVATK